MTTVDLKTEYIVSNSVAGESDPPIVETLFLEKAIAASLHFLQQHQPAPEFPSDTPNQQITIDPILRGPVRTLCTIDQYADSQMIVLQVAVDHGNSKAGRVNNFYGQVATIGLPLTSLLKHEVTYYHSKSSTPLPSRTTIGQRAATNALSLSLRRHMLDPTTPLEFKKVFKRLPLYSKLKNTIPVLTQTPSVSHDSFTNTVFDLLSLQRITLQQDLTDIIEPHSPSTVFLLLGDTAKTMPIKYVRIFVEMMYQELVLKYLEI
jgi:hypothetical protein